MASTLVDLVKVKVTSIGTGALALGSAVPGFRGIEALTNGQQYSYSIQQGGNFEVGRGTYLSASDTLVRSPLYSSTGGTAISIAQGAEVSFVALAEDFAFLFSLITFLSTQTAGWAEQVQAFEDIPAGSWTNSYFSAGDTYVRRANAADPLKFCNGFVPEAISAGDVGTIAVFGLNTGFVPTTMDEVYLSDSAPGEASMTAPSTEGHIIQPLGRPVVGVGVFFSPQPRILL